MVRKHRVPEVDALLPRAALVDKDLGLGARAYGALGGGGSGGGGDGGGANGGGSDGGLHAPVVR